MREYSNMTKPLSSLGCTLCDSTKGSLLDELVIEEFEPKYADELTRLIYNNLKEFDQKEKVFSTINRRLENFSEEYSQEGHYLFVARDMVSAKPVACIGLGSFQGLPISEKIGEVRDLVVQKEFRYHGLGQKLLKKALLRAREFGYERLYLEVSKHMQVANKIFCQNGFNPVKHLQKDNKPTREKNPSYFLLEDLRSQILDAS